MTAIKTETKVDAQCQVEFRVKDEPEGDSANLLLVLPIPHIHIHQLGRCQTLGPGVVESAPVHNTKNPLWGYNPNTVKP